MLTDLTVSEFLEKTASAEPAPGGGSVSALCAAASCALIQMVAGLTVGKKDCLAAEEEMQEMLPAMEQKRAELLGMIDEDAAAFDKVMAALRMPKSTEEEKQLRSSAIQAATKEAAAVPLRLAESACGLMEFCGAVAERGNQNAASDAAVAAMLCRTAVLGALYNVRINLSSIRDRAFALRYEKRAAELEAIVQFQEQKVLNLIQVS